jgi:hypothetical protein
LAIYFYSIVKKISINREFITEFFYPKMFSPNGEKLPPKKVTNTLRCFIGLFSVGGGAQGQGYD